MIDGMEYIMQVGWIPDTIKKYGSEPEKLARKIIELERELSEKKRLLVEIKNRYNSLMKEYQVFREKVENGEPYKKYIRLKYRKPAYKDLDIDKIRELRSKGVSLREIAAQVGCSPNTVKSRLKTIKLQDELRGCYDGDSPF